MCIRDRVESRNVRILRVADNMRNVAVTEGDKVEAQIKLGWTVDAYPVNEIAEYVAAVSQADTDALVDEYYNMYDILLDGRDGKEFRLSLIHILYLYIKGIHGENISLAFWDFFEKNKLLLFYFIAINIITFIAFGVDKQKAIEQKSRIRIITLLGLSFIGGAIGGWIDMYTFRHKTKKDYFTVGLPLIVFMHIVVILYLMNL